MIELSDFERTSRSTFLSLCVLLTINTSLRNTVVPESRDPVTLVQDLPPACGHNSQRKESIAELSAIYCTNQSTGRHTKESVDLSVKTANLEFEFYLLVHCSLSTLGCFFSDL